MRNMLLANSAPAAGKQSNFPLRVQQSASLRSLFRAHFSTFFSFRNFIFSVCFRYLLQCVVAALVAANDCISARLAIQWKLVSGKACCSNHNSHINTSWELWHPAPLSDARWNTLRQRPALLWKLCCCCSKK